MDRPGCLVRSVRLFVCLLVFCIWIWMGEGASGFKGRAAREGVHMAKTLERKALSSTSKVGGIGYVTMPWNFSQDPLGNSLHIKVTCGDDLAHYVVS